MSGAVTLKSLTDFTTIISKSTSKKILYDLKKASKSGQTQAYCNFNYTPTLFQYENGKVNLRQNIKIEKVQNLVELQFQIPEELLLNSQEKNIAYEVTIQKDNHEENSNDPNKKQFTSYFGDQVVRFSPLVHRALDGTLIKLTEPQVHQNIIGPILELNSMKMHISKGYKTTYDWSKLLASYAKVKKTKKIRNTLDMFLGLSYSSRSVFDNDWSDKVFTFEKYDEVVDLVSRNRLFSVDTKNPNFVLHPKRIDIDQQTQDFFDAIHNYKITFDSVIIDPPKNQVMMKVYSESFLSRLSQYIKSGAPISCYVPQEVHGKQLHDVLESIIKTFESSNYKFIEVSEKSDTIYVFERK